MMNKILVTTLAVSLLGGCATVKVPQPIDGSRSDGTLKFAYEYGALENPQVQMEPALEEANRRCQAWGYERAEPFGGTGFKQCVASNAYGNCVRWRNILSFQCIGKGDRDNK